MTTPISTGLMISRDPRVTFGQLASQATRPMFSAAGLNQNQNHKGDQVTFSGRTGVGTANPLFGSSEAPMRLADYKPFSHEIPKNHLTYELNSDEDVVVTSRTEIHPNPDSTEPGGTITLKGAPEKAPEGA